MTICVFSVGGALPEPEDVLVAIGGKPYRDSENMLIEVHAVDQDRDEIEVVERTLHQLVELLRADCLPVAADRALADPVAIADSVDGLLVVAHRDAERDLASGGLLHPNHRFGRAPCVRDEAPCRRCSEHVAA